MNSPDTVALTTERAVLELLPASGGCIARFAVYTPSGEVDILRPLNRDALFAGGTEPIDPRDTACFPLVPYSGRVRDGRFVWGGREVRERLNFLPEPHAIHGHGWQNPWLVEALRDDSATLAYTHDPGDWDPGAWPFAYTARQQFRLVPPDGVSTVCSVDMSVSLTNLSQDPMPAGLGLHPYFPRTAEARLAADVHGVWLTDDEAMPVERAGLPANMPLPDGIAVTETPLDNAFTAFGGSAEIEWPERDLKVHMRAGKPLSFLVVYTPPGESFFCVEPVSNCTDAFNLAAAGRDDTGTLTLAPGRSVRADVRLEVMRR